MINGRITVTNFQRRTNIMAVVNPNYIPWPYLSKLCSKFKSAQDYKLYPGLIRNLNSKTCILTFYYCYYIYKKRVIWREEESTLITSLVRKYYSYIASIIYFPTSDFIVQKILLGNFFENFDSNAWNSDTSNYAQLVIRIRRNGKAKFRQTFPLPLPLKNRENVKFDGITNFPQHSTSIDHSRTGWIRVLRVRSKVIVKISARDSRMRW